MVPALSDRSLGPRSVVARTGGVVRAAAFWSAVALPVAAILALVAGRDLTFVALLLVSNATALVVGHDYRAPTADGRRNHDH